VAVTLSLFMSLLRLMFARANINRRRDMNKDRVTATGLSLLAVIAVAGPGCGVEGEGDQGGATASVTSALITSATRVSADGKYTVNLTNTDPNLPDATINNLVNDFFNSYPKIAARWNSAAATTVKFTFRPPNAGEDMPPAYTSGNEITLNTQWLIGHPDDWDVIVHEETHVVQAGFTAPGWLIEGQADYARDAYGIHNAQEGWTLATVNLSVNYTWGYGEAAAFIKWVERNVRATMMNDLTSAMKAGTTSDALWKTLTGKTIVQLWNLYDPGHPIPEAGVTFFQDVNYGGHAVTLARGTYTLAQLQALNIGTVKDHPENTDISSIKVSPGFSIIVYDNDNDYQTPNNPSWWFNADAPNFTSVTVNGVTSNINDIVSSVWIF